MIINKLAGMNIHSLSEHEMLSIIKKDIESDIKKQYISITNTEAMFFGKKEKTHFNYINNARLSLCDGVGVKLAAKWHGENIKRYHGPDFFYDVIKNSEKYGWTHYFLGGNEGVGNKLKSKFQKQHPNLKIVGVYSPPFRQLTNEEELKMLDRINIVKPNFVWVSLGLPKQEKWIMKYLPELDLNFACGVGAAFDFHTDAVKRAPVFFQKIGMEWLYRTFFERRLVVRQIRGFKFMFKAMLNNK